MKSIDPVRVILASATMLEQHAHSKNARETLGPILGNREKMYSILASAFNATLVAKEGTAQEYCEAVHELFLLIQSIHYLASVVYVSQDEPFHAIAKMETLLKFATDALELANNEQAI
jgi:hypothetical protein